MPNTTQLTYEEIIKILEEFRKQKIDGFIYDVEYFCNYNLTQENKEKYPELYKLGQLLGPVEECGEGRNGDEFQYYEEVLHFKNHNVYVCYNGSYSSWDGNGMEYGDPEHVEPYQVTVTKFKSVK